MRFLCCLALLMSPFSLHAAAKSLGKHGDWHGYQKGDVCYMVSLAKKSEGNYTKRGDVYAVVTHRPKEKTKDVLSLNAGYPFGKDATVDVTINAKAGNKSEKMYTDGETAWCLDQKTDSEMVAFMTKKGSTMTVQGASARGTKTKDTYSLKGSLAAYKAISKACRY